MIFLSISCAVLTSFDTTNALIGLFIELSTTEANWLTPELPTVLTCGTVACGIDGAAIEIPPPDGIADFILDVAERIDAMMPTA